MRIYKHIIFVLILMQFVNPIGHAQTYELTKKKDLSLVAGGVGIAAVGALLRRNASDVSLSELNRLNSSNLNRLDKRAINYQSTSARSYSDILLFSTMSLPVISLLSKNCRSHTLTYGVMGVETLLITYGITDIIKASVVRYRPYAYNPLISNEIKFEATTKRSFFSGHTSMASAFSFFTAGVFTKLNPDANKILIWSTAATIPAVMGILRVRAGRHFPTDVASGYVLGAAIGILIPKMHLVDSTKIEISGVGNGIGLIYHFN